MSSPKIINGAVVWGLKTPEEMAADQTQYDRDFAIFTAKFAAMIDDEVRTSDDGLGPEGIWVNQAYVDTRRQAFEKRGLEMPR